MFGTIFFPLSRIITAVIVFFTSIFGGMGWEAAIGQAPPSLDPLAYPAWIHSHWVWENVGYCHTIKDFVADMQAEGIPIGAVIIDRPWEASVHSMTTGEIEDSVGSYIPCPVRYCCFYEEWLANREGREPTKQFVQHFHDMGIRVLVWGTGMVNINSPNHFYNADDWYDYVGDPPQRSYFLNNGRVVSWWGGYGSMIDYTNPAAVEWWERQLNNVLDMGLETQFGVGVDGWKVDGTDPYVMLMLPAIAHTGNLIGWNSYKYLAYRHWIDYSWENFGAMAKVRPVDDYLFRLGLPFRFSPREGNFLTWVGDQDNDWGGLRAALNNMFGSALFNYVNIGSDIGGFRGGPDHPQQWDVWLRWAQMGAFSTLMEMESTLAEVPRDFIGGGGGGDYVETHRVHRPWRFYDLHPELAELDIDILGTYRQFVLLHTELAPYMRSQVMFSYERRQPTLRPTFGYYQYMLGDELFIAPIVSGGDITGNTRRIIFPRGDEWIYLFDESRVFRGGTMHNLHFPYDEFPAFVRRGAIIPMDSVVDVPVGAAYELCDYTTIRIYPARGSNRFGLFEDDVRGAMIRYTMDRNSLNITMDATARQLLFRLFDITASEVLLDGVALDTANSLDALRDAGLGYYVDGDGILWVAVAEASAGVEIEVRF